MRSSVSLDDLVLATRPLHRRARSAEQSALFPATRLSPACAAFRGSGTTPSVSDVIPVGHGVSLGVRWRQFRGFEDTQWLRLKPLTILLGANSSGKSSLIAPLLLMKQSLSSQTGRNALLTRGEYVNVGSFRDFAHDHRLDATVTLGLRWHSHPASQAKRPVGQYAPGGVEVGFVRDDDLHQVKLASYRVEDLYRRAMLRRTLDNDGRFTLRMARIPQSARRADSKGQRAKVKKAIRAAAREARPVDFLFTSTAVRYAAINVGTDRDAPTFPAPLDDDRIRFYCQIVDSVELQVEEIFTDLYFLGPLREPPKRVYELSGEMPPDVGTRGEHAPEILYRWRNNEQRMKEVNTWLSHFGFSERVRFEAVGDEGFALSFGPKSRANSVLDIGFGLSQILPLIVQGLRAPPRSWLIVEQPEIHLNPRLQAALADLVVELSKRDVGLIVETHSEHFLLRLRRLLANDSIAVDDVGLHFVERSGSDSFVREVPLEQSGYIEPSAWPRGFFDDSLRESLALAQAQSARPPADLQET
jgi:hypothetical protein